MAEPTGIAGAEANAPRRARACHVCGGDMESPALMRSMPGVGLVGACSAACAADDKFRPALEVEVDRLRAQIAAMREMEEPND